MKWRFKSSIGPAADAPARRAALDAEDGAERRPGAGRARPTRRSCRSPWRQPSGRSSSCPRRRFVGVTAVTQMIFAVGTVGTGDRARSRSDLGLVLAVLLDLVVQQACLGGDLGDGPRGRLPGRSRDCSSTSDSGSRGCFGYERPAPRMRSRQRRGKLAATALARPPARRRPVCEVHIGGPHGRAAA